MRATLRARDELPFYKESQSLRRIPPEERALPGRLTRMDGSVHVGDYNPPAPDPGAPGL
jgi:hypothetical protein